MYQKVVIAGVGMVPFRKPGQSPSYDRMGAQAAQAALADAGIPYALVEQAFVGYVHGDSCASQAAPHPLCGCAAKPANDRSRVRVLPCSTTVDWAARVLYIFSRKADYSKGARYAF